MDGAPRLIDVLMHCAGVPATPEAPGTGCEAPLQVVLTQVRPDASGGPTVLTVGACAAHARQVKARLRETWPHDRVMVWPAGGFDETLGELLGEMMDDGVSVLTPQGVYRR